MKRSSLLITMLFVCAIGYAQKPHPRDREIEAAIRAYFESMDTVFTLEGFKYIEGSDISEKEYTGMAAGKFETGMYLSKYAIKEDREEQERILQRKKLNLYDTKLQQRYDDTLAQLAAHQRDRQDEYDRNKLSLDSCTAVVKNADSVNNFGYLAYVRVALRYKNMPGDAYLSNDIEEVILTKELYVRLYMRLEKEQLAFLRE